MLIMFFLYEYLFLPWLHTKMILSGTEPSLHYPDKLSLFSPFFSLEGWGNLISRFFGHIFYLSIGTVGLIWLGFFNLFSGLFAIKNEPSDSEVLHRWPFRILLVFSILGVLGLSVLFFSSTTEADRLDHWMYGRYVEAVIAPILIIGALTIKLKKLLLVVPIVLLSAIIFSGSFDDFSNVIRVNVTAFWQDFYYREDGIFIWAISGLFFIILAACIPKNFGFFVIFTVFLFSSYLHINWHTAAVVDMSKRWEPALFVRDHYSTNACVGFDRASINLPSEQVVWFDYGFQLYNYRLMKFSQNYWLNNCSGPLFSFNEDLDLNYPDFNLFSLSFGQGPHVWIKAADFNFEVYPFVLEEGSVFSSLFLKNGWYESEKFHVWSSNQAQLFLPTAQECSLKKCYANINFTVFGASKDRPVFVISELNNSSSPMPIFKIIINNAQQSIQFPLAGDEDGQTVTFTVPGAISPYNLVNTNDKRILGVALQSVSLIKN
tara:strand:- start:1210 stop:2676 length:1467 start_codon:yes stop_codon:yes gene_type:complete